MDLFSAVSKVHIVPIKGKRFAIIDLDEWERLVERCEDAEDEDVAKQYVAESAKGDGKIPGTLTLEEFKMEMEAYERISSKRNSKSSPGRKKIARQRAPENNKSHRSVGR